MSGFVGFYRAENFFHLINISSELKLVDVYRPLCIACPVYRTRSCRVLSGSTELKIYFISSIFLLFEGNIVDVYRPLSIACPVYRTRQCRVLSGSTELKISFI